jgi:hypothetical protein
MHGSATRKVGNEKPSFDAASSSGWGRRCGFLQSSGWGSRLPEAGQIQAIHLCNRAQAQQVIPGLCRGPDVCLNSALLMLIMTEQVVT